MILDFESILASIVPSISPDNFTDKVDVLDIDEDREIKVLYCEDSELVQKVALKAFKKAGIENVKVFSSGKQGLDYLLAHKNDHIDVIISDIEMPEMDGLTFCKNLKTHPELSSIPVLFFSSTINDQMKEKCKSMGGVGSYAKPEIHKLIASIGTICKASK